MDQVVASTLLREFIGYVKSNWSAHSKVNQDWRRLRQLVARVRALVDAAEGGTQAAAVRDKSLSCWLQRLRFEATRGQEVLDDTARAVAVASSARGFLAGLKRLVVGTGSEEAERLAEAVEQLKDLLSSGNLDGLLWVLTVHADRAAAAEEDDMDVDGRPARGARRRRRQKGGTVAALLPSRGKKRACDDGGGGLGVDAGSTPRGEVDAVRRPSKRRRPAWMRSHQGLPSGFGRVSSAPRVPPEAELRRSPRLALAMSRIQREATLGRQFSRIAV